GSYIRLWDYSYKGQERPLSDDGFQFVVTTQARQKYELWVEATTWSASLREIWLEMEYQGRRDRVRATAVWAEFDSAKHDRSDAQWRDFYVPNAFQITGWSDPEDRDLHYGLRPIDESVANNIGFRFVVLPRGIQTVKKVQFDITRQRMGRITEDGVDRPFPDTVVNWPAGDHRKDSANDDNTQDLDESPEPTNTNNASQLGAMFSIDVPGGSSNARTKQLLIYRYNFYEFMRVSFSPQPPPEGNGQRGSRCSDKIDWHVCHRLANNGGSWSRTTGDDPEVNHVNCIHRGHINVWGEN
ncbi:MAG: hypothetical protein NZT92_15865, partial [Abditibacteriales bacterium]|nr:hypothetical protein [Abditibacteriales bacterium]